MFRKMNLIYFLLLCTTMSDKWVLYSPDSTIKFPQIVYEYKEVKFDTIKIYNNSKHEEYFNIKSYGKCGNSLCGIFILQPQINKRGVRTEWKVKELKFTKKGKLTEHYKFKDDSLCDANNILTSHHKNFVDFMYPVW